MKGWLPSPRMAIALLLVLCVIAFLILLGFGHLRMRQLEEAHDEAVLALAAVSDGPPERPVLRGEARPGDGGPIIDELLKVRGEGDWKDWWLLWDRAKRGANPKRLPGEEAPGDAERRAAVYAASVPRLPEVRKALQHETCIVRFGSSPRFHGRDPGATYRTLAVSAALLIEAEEHAAEGRDAEALRNIADAVRLGHDLARRPDGVWDFSQGLQVEGLALWSAARILTENDLAAEPIDACLREIDVLESSRPGVATGMHVQALGSLVMYYLYLDGQIQGLRTNSVADRTGTVGELLQRGGWKIDSFWELERRGREIVELPDEEFRREYARYRTDRADGGPLVRHLPDPEVDRERALLRRGQMACLRAALLVERYRALHGGAWPEDLADCADTLPVDPWSGSPVRFRPAEGTLPPRVYLDGPDRGDGGGRALSPFAETRHLRNADFVVPFGPWPDGGGTGAGE